MISFIIKRLADLIYPPMCPICGEPVLYGETHIVCPECMAGLNIIVDGPFCDVCGAPTDNVGNCKNCKGEFYFDRAIAAFSYNEPMRAALHDIKYRRKPGKAAGLAIVMSEILTPLLEEYRSFDLIIPVPLHKNRMRKRGFNQAYILALPLSKALGVPVDNNICVRTKDTAYQSLLKPHERNLNVSGIFRLDKNADIYGKNIIIVDDIITTGSTLDSLSKVLKQAGAKSVICLSLSITHSREHL